MGLYEGIVTFIKRNKYSILSVGNIVFSCLLFNFAYLFQNEFHKLVSIASFLTWHSIFEIVSIVVSFAVFVVCYYTYYQTKSLRSVFLGSVFLSVGITDLFHVLSYKGMPDFLISNQNANRATTLWIISGLLIGFGFLISGFIPQDKKKLLPRSIFSIIPMAIGVTSLIIATYYPMMLPPMYIEGEGLTDIKINLEYFIIILLFAAIIKYYHEYRKTKDNLIALLINAFILRIFSGLAFTLYDSVYDIYNCLGHVYKAIFTFVIFRVLFIYNVQKPYVELSSAQVELKRYIENLDYIVEKRTRELNLINQRLMDDLEYARDIQLALLPTSFPNISEVSFEARYFPAERIGGDFYNIFKIDDEHIGMYIGDVSGHGVPAAMLTVFLNQNIHPTKEITKGKIEIISPSEVLTSVYDSFNKTNFKDDVYVVMLYAIYNIRTKIFTYSSAGLNVAPLLFRNFGGIDELKISGFPICKFIEYYTPGYEDQSIKLNSGDKILFYTDGLTEAKNQHGERFSFDSIQLVYNKYVHTIGMQSKMLVEEILRFTDGCKFNDDITFFLMHVN